MIPQVASFSSMLTRGEECFRTAGWRLEGKGSPQGLHDTVVGGASYSLPGIKFQSSYSALLITALMGLGVLSPYSLEEVRVEVIKGWAWGSTFFSPLVFVEWLLCNTFFFFYLARQPLSWCFEWSHWALAGAFSKLSVYLIYLSTYLPTYLFICCLICVCWSFGLLDFSAFNVEYKR